VLEDQLCAFTTAGYRGEGSPDHADALVFAITELMLKADNTAIIEFYRLKVEGREEAKPAATAAASEAPANVRLRAPENISGVHGLSSTYYMVGADRVIAVVPEDAAPLIKSGYEQLAEEATEATGPMSGAVTQSSLPPSANLSVPEERRSG
jgi:hypothetical protein